MDQHGQLLARVCRAVLVAERWRLGEVQVARRRFGDPHRVLWRKRNAVAATGARRLYAIGEQRLCRRHVDLAPGPINAVALTIGNVNGHGIRRRGEAHLGAIEDRIVRRRHRIGAQRRLEFGDGVGAAADHGIGIDGANPRTDGGWTYRVPVQVIGCGCRVRVGLAAGEPLRCRHPVE
jgi:hypothetical protein